MRNGSLFSRCARALSAVALLLGTMIAMVGVNVGVASATSSAGFTTVNEGLDGTGHCKNGNPAVNCNIYDGKQYVWMNGGPVNAALGDGTYFFAVLDPSGQANPNDGSPANLSSPNDAYTNRTFTVSGGVVSYSGTHAFDSNKIRLMPYNDTSNPGGVYIMAICSLGDGTNYPVTPKDCKYDAFKVQTTTPPPGTLDGLLSATKTVTPSFTRTYAWDIKKSVDNSKLTVPSGTGATFNYEVTATKTLVGDSGFQLTGNITVDNDPGAGNANNISVTDIPTFNDSTTASCTIYDPTAGPPTVYNNDASLAPGGEIVFQYSCDLSGASATTSGVNSATVDWTNDPGGVPPNDSTVSLPAPFDFSTTTPTLSHNCATFTDTLEGSLGDICASQPFDYPLTFTAPDGTCADHNNTASFTVDDNTQITGSADQKVTVCGAADLTVSKNVTPAYTRSFTWGITKDVNQTEFDIPSGGTATAKYTVKVTHDSGTDSNWHASGQITVTNPNDFEDITANVTDVIDNGGICTVTNGTNVVVPRGKSVQLDYSCTYSSQPAYLSTFTNKGTATWDATSAGTADGSADGTATGSFTDPTKTVDTCVEVNDTIGGDLGPACVTNANNPIVFTYSHDFTGTPGACTDYPNTATFTTNDTGTTGQASQSVKVCVGADLTASKTATPYFTRKYNWSIKKSVDKSGTVNVSPGNVTLNYTVTVTEGTATDSAWKVTGVISVTNPNLWEPITANVSDAVDNGGSCKVEGDAVHQAQIPINSTALLNYTCTWSSAPSATSGTNTATVTWDGTGASTPDSSTKATAGFAFTTPTTTIDKSVTLTDTNFINPPGNPTGIIITLNDPLSPNPYVKTYSKTVTVPPDRCLPVTNTAAISTTPPQSAQTNTMLCPNVTGGLTMGFWQNKNGQAIISGGSSTGGVCNSATWLRQFHPFSDLAANSTCAQVATYVFNLVKAANAGGTSMNPMLKAQMMATALDVYFSDPALGGNKISAPVALGGVKIDLTKICKMIDSSSGGSCSGSFENVSSAFGGATELTIMQMLVYQNSAQADPSATDAGASWYSQNKTTQGLAKDAFDAINNSAAFVGP
jgi:hypothetical protein